MKVVNIKWHVFIAHDVGEGSLKVTDYGTIR